MKDQSHKACAKRLRIAVDLADSGIAMRRAQLRRTHPNESTSQIDERLNRWLRERPGAKFGDAPGRLVDPSSIFES